jgi:ribosome-associated toxin RatA of RatAB toxin-antitoxin module
MAVHLEASIFITSPLKKVYQIAETYPTFVTSYHIKSIIENTDDKIVVSVGYRLFGFPVVWKGLGKKIRYSAINYTQTEGFLKGMEARWNFIPHGDKTEVRIIIDIEKSFRFFNWAVKKNVNKTIRSILIDLRKTSEKEEAKCGL